MFFNHELLCKKNGKFTIIWLAATNIKKLHRKDVLNVAIRRSARELGDYILGKTSDKTKLSLYLSSQLLYGLCIVFSKQVVYLLDDLKDFQNKFATLTTIVGATGFHGIDLPTSLHAEKNLLLPDASFFAELAEQADATIFAMPDEVPEDGQESEFTFVDSIFRSSGTAPAQHVAPRERITLHDEPMMIEQTDYYQNDFGHGEGVIAEEEFLHTDAEAFVADIARETAERMKERGELIDQGETSTAQLEFEAPMHEVAETSTIETRTIETAPQSSPVNAESEEANVPPQRPLLPSVPIVEPAELTDHTPPSAESASMDLGPAAKRTPPPIRRRVGIVTDRNTEVATGTIRKWIMQPGVATRPRDEAQVDVKKSSASELFQNPATIGGRLFGHPLAELWNKRLVTIGTGPEVPASAEGEEEAEPAKKQKRRLPVEEQEDTEAARQSGKRRRMPSPIRAVQEEAEAGVQPDMHEAAMESDVQMADVPPEEYSESDRARLDSELLAGVDVRIPERDDVGTRLSRGAEELFRLIDDTILTNASIYDNAVGQTRTFFDELVPPQKHQKFVAAASFCQLLSLVKARKVEIRQDEPYGRIEIKLTIGG